MTPAFKFGQRVRAQVKSASTIGNVLDGLSTSWNNASRVFKGGMGAVGGTLGFVGGGLAAGGMQGANAVGGLFGRQPFSNEAIETAYGAADHYANAGTEYGRDLAQGLGAGRHGLAGTTMNNPSFGDQYSAHLQNMPGVTDDARRVSATGHGMLDFSAKAAPAAAIGGALGMANNYTTAQPLMKGVSSWASQSANAAKPLTGAAANAVQKATQIGKGLNSTSNPLGAGAGAVAAGSRAFEQYKPPTPNFSGSGVR